MTISNLPQPVVVVVIDVEQDHCNDEKLTNTAHSHEPQIIQDNDDENDMSPSLSSASSSSSSSSTSSSSSSFSDSISVDSAIHCNSLSSEQSSLAGDKPTCRICLCTNDELDDDGNSVGSAKISKKKVFNKIMKKSKNNNIKQCKQLSQVQKSSNFVNFDPNDPHILVTPCYCSGTLQYVHHKCLQQWIRTSSRQFCDMCRYHFKLHIKNKPFYMWECIKMTSRQKRRFVFHSLANLFAFMFVFWSTHVILDRAIHDLTSHRRMNLRVWVKMLVIMFTLLSGFAFIYFQLKSFFESLMRLKRYNQIVIIENIAKDTLQKVQSFKSIQLADINNLLTNKQTKENDKSDVSASSLSQSLSPSSSSPSSPSALSDVFYNEIVISIDATAQKIVPTHS